MVGVAHDRLKMEVSRGHQRYTKYSTLMASVSLNCHKQTGCDKTNIYSRVANVFSRRKTGLVPFAGGNASADYSKLYHRECEKVKSLQQMLEVSKAEQKQNSNTWSVSTILEIPVS